MAMCLKILILLYLFSDCWRGSLADVTSDHNDTTESITPTIVGGDYESTATPGYISTSTGGQQTVQNQSDEAIEKTNNQVTLELVESPDELIKMRNTTSPIIVDIPVVFPESEVAPKHVQAILPPWNRMWYHSVSLSNDSSLHIVVQPDDATSQLEIYLRHALLPTLNNSDLFDILPHALTDIGDITDLADDVTRMLRYTIVIQASVIRKYGFGQWYVGVRIHDDANDGTTTMAFNYTISIRTYSCYDFGEGDDDWSTNNCLVSPLSNTEFVRCVCDP